MNVGNSSSKPICLVHGRIFTPHRIIDDGCIVVRNGLIAAVGRRSEITPPADAEVIDVAGMQIIPGLIDLHLHGIEGQDVSGGDISVISEALAKHGVTSFVASLVAAPHNELVDAIEHLVAGCNALPGAKMVGIHLEGPYISPNQAGALNPRFFRLPNQGEAMELLRAGRGKIRIMTIAPELEGASQLISWLSSQGVVPSIGHSDASFEQVASAVKNGLQHATHLFNAMRQFHHREPGAVGAVLDHNEITAEIIADGHHVHPAAIRLLLRLKGVDRVCLVSDAMPLAGLAPGIYTWLGKKVTIDDATARLQNRTLAGSITPLNVALRNLIELTGIPFEIALRTASSTPARVLSLNSGVIEVGKDADIVVLDSTFRARTTLVQGRVVYQGDL